MAEFFDIKSNQFTRVTPDGSEEIQIASNKKTSLRDIADLKTAENMELSGIGQADLIRLNVHDMALKETDTVLKAFEKLSVGLINGGRTKIISDGYSSIAMLMYDTDNSIGSWVLINTEESYMRYGFEGLYEEILNDKTDQEILDHLINDTEAGNKIDLYNISENKLSKPISSIVTSLDIFNIYNASIVKYTGSIKQITARILSNNFDDSGRTAVLIVPYDTKVLFSKPSEDNLYIQKDMDNVNLTSGLKVYSIMVSKANNNSRDIFINMACYEQ